MPGRRARLDADEVGRHYPFHLVVDRALRLVECGPAHGGLCDEAAPRLDDVFGIRRPGPDAGFEALRAADRFALLERVDDGLLLRGAFTALDDDHLLFLGTPWVSSLDALTRRGIALRDLGPSHPMADLLVALHAKEAALRDAGELAEQLQRERASLEQAWAGNAAMVQAALDAIVTMNAAGEVVSFNAAAERLFGWRADEAVGRPLGELIIPPRYRAQHQRGMDRYLASGVSQMLGRRLELTAVDRAGNELPVEAAIVDLGHGERRFVAYLRDITRQRAARAAIEQARVAAEEESRAKSQFLAAISHDVRTPLNAVLTLSQLAIDAVEPDARQRYIERVHVNARVLVGLVDDLLDLSKIDAQQLDIEPRPFSLVDLLHESIETIAHSVVDRPVSLRVVTAPDLPKRVNTDPRRLRQVLDNLLANAARMTERGSIEVGARCAPEARGRSRLQLWVADTGPGIPFQLRHRLFEPFVRSSDGVWSERSGSGLGLSICRGIVELLGGAITFETELGRGTRFEIELPIEVTTAPPVVPAEPPGPRGRATQRVLVVDDNGDNRLALAVVLRREGWTVELARDGREAVDRTFAFDPHVILMDVEMPVLDGLEATALIRRGEAARGLPRRPIVALTAHAVGDFRQRCLDAGMDDFYSKPIDLGRLVDGVQRLLERGRSQPPVDAAPPDDPAPTLPDDPDILALLPGFLARRASLPASLRVALATGDFEAVRREAHDMEGSCGLYGLTELARHAVDLQAHAVARRQAEALEAIDGFERALARVAAELDRSAGLDQGR